MDVQYCCFIALEEELDYLSDRLGKISFKCKLKSSDEYVFQKKDLRGRNIRLRVLFNKEMGNIGSAVRVNTELARFEDYKAIFIIGIAGSLDLDIHKLGNVVVASSAKFLSPDKFFESSVAVETVKKVGKSNILRFRRDFIKFDKTTKFLERYLAEREENSDWKFRPIPLELLEHDEALVPFVNEAPEVKFGCVLGSEYVVDSEELVSFLKQRDTDLTRDWYSVHEKPEDNAQRNKWNKDAKFAVSCIDMETYGFFRAAQAMDFVTHPISIRGISDPCANKKAIEAKSKDIRRLAMENAVDVFVDMMDYIVDNQTKTGFAVR